MIRISLTELFRTRGIGTLMAGLLFATSKRCGAGEQMTSARKPSAAQTSAEVETVAATVLRRICASRPRCYFFCQ